MTTGSPAEPQSVLPPPKPRSAACSPLPTLAQYRHKARKAWRKPRLERGELKRLVHTRRCLTGTARRAAIRYTRKLRAQHRAVAIQSSITPYHCGSHGWFAIPCYIVSCETGGTWNKESRNASSGAYGWYQLMSTWWPHPPPLTAYEQHKAAHDLWNGGAGASNWDCA